MEGRQFLSLFREGLSGFVIALTYEVQKLSKGFFSGFLSLDITQGFEVTVKVGAISFSAPLRYLSLPQHGALHF